MNILSQPITIKNVTLKNRVILAPLAGVSDVPFRRICQELGAGLTFVEMLSAVAIKYQSAKTWEMMGRHPKENVLGVQVTGPDAETVANAVEILDKKGFDWIDINMGCPVKKVTQSGCGSAIIRDPNLVRDMLHACRKVTRKPLSAKIRIGYTRDALNVETNAKVIATAETDMITIHGRTRSESYSTPVDRAQIALGLNKYLESSSDLSAKLIVANGDIFSRHDANLMVQQTPCNSVMVSRGSLGNPWIFPEIIHNESIQPTLEEWWDVVSRHISYQKDHFKDPKFAAILMRKHLLWYAKGFPKIKELRNQLNIVNTLEEAAEIFQTYVTQHPPTLKRYEDSSALKNQHASDPKYEMDRKLDRGVGDDCMIETSQVHS